MTPEHLRVWQKVLEGSLHGYLLKRYPQEIKTYDRFLKSTGRHCAFCKASARLVFKQEAVFNKNFLDDFANNNFDGYI